MKCFPSNLIAAVALTAGSLAFAQAEPASSQDSPPAKSHALLQKVKQDQLDWRIAIKQTEIDRLKLDLDKGKKDMDAMQKNLDSTNSLIVESGSNLDRLAAEEKHLEQTLDLTELKIEAERKNSEGLKSLSIAQGKALDAINQRMAEMDIRSRVREFEVQLLSQGKPVPGEDNDEKGSADLEKLKKGLASSESKTVAAETLALDSMKAASARLQSADEAAAQAQRVADGLAKGTLDQIGEQPDDADQDSPPRATLVAPPRATLVKPKGTATPTPGLTKRQ
jgi:uncharacterized small protein (DUF1192 family)